MKTPIAIAEKSKTLRILMRGTRNYIRRVRYKKSGRNANIDEKLIIFGAYNGKSYACSPKAIYEYMLSHSEFDEYKFVWIFDEPEKYKFLEKNRDTVLVKNAGRECEKYLHIAKYWIFNFRALDFWKPSKEQVYVQCWHGTPLKKLGYDIERSNNAMNSPYEIRSKYDNDAKRLDYLVSPCDFVTEKFRTAWNLKKHRKEDAVLQIGYPRNDYLSNYDEEDALKIKKALGLENDNRKIILYAPTWRDNQHDAVNGYVYENPVDFDKLKASLEKDYIILFRAHYLVADDFDFEAYKGFVYNASYYDDINELYIISDLLITDYSSVFFDYAILNRPMLFYMYDMEEYRDELRGFYIDVNSLPGEIVTTEDALLEAIERVDYSPEKNKKALADFNAEYNTMNDGNATQRLLRIIF